MELVLLLVCTSYWTEEDITDYQISRLLHRYLLCWPNSRVYYLELVLLHRYHSLFHHNHNSLSIHTFRYYRETDNSSLASPEDGLARRNPHHHRAHTCNFLSHRLLARTPALEDTLYILSFHPRLPFTSVSHLYRRLGCRTAAPPTITLQSSSHASTHARFISYVRFPRHLSSLRHLLHGNYHERDSPAGRRMVCTYGPWRMSYLYIWRFSPTSPSWNFPRHHCWHILDYRSLTLRHRTTRRELLGLYIPFYGLRYHRYRYNIQHK